MKDLSIENSTALTADVYAGMDTGFENVRVEDVSIPFLRILQSQSPQVKKGAERVDGAEEGDIFNTVTREVFKGEAGIQVVPCHFKVEFLEWVPRVHGGGLVAVHKDANILEQTTKGGPRGKTDVLPNGNEIVTTAYHSVLVKSGDDWQRAIISMSSTQRKKSRAWLGKMMTQRVTVGGQSVTAPSFAFIYTLRTGLETRDQDSWYNWVIGESAAVESRDLAIAAKQFLVDLKKGAVELPSSEAIEAEAGRGEAKEQDVF